MLYARDFLFDQSILRSDNAPVSPAVSIILPTFARCASGLLERAIKSVLAQSFTDWELLVIDDGSVDGTFDLVEHFRAADPRIIHVRHERNSGIHSLRLNEGIELARGEYLAFQFDDDFWRPSALKTLADEAKRHTEPVLVAGRSLLKIDSKERILPEGDLDPRRLMQSNQIANNNVLFPRELANELGMYDCHLGMRRLCDWDLWLRYCRQVPIVLVDRITTEINAAQDGSIGLTLPWDLALFRYLHEMPRNHLLRPHCWRNYEIDSLRIGDVEIAKEFRKRLHEEYFVPYYLKHRHHIPQIEGFSATLPSEHKTALYIRNWHEPTHEIAFNHYDAIPNRSYKSYYQQVDQVGNEWQAEADMLLLVRSSENEAKDLMAEALACGKPVGYYLDDDLLSFHEYGPEFDYLAPGSHAYQNIEELIEGADAVWCNTPYLESSIKQKNPRTVPHHGCVPAEFLPREIRKRDPNRPLRIGYAGTGYRADEFDHIWEALQNISREYGDRLVFEFWGLDVSRRPPLNSPVVQRAYDPSYLSYLAKLRNAEFDIMLMPLLDHPRPRLAKSVSKYFQAAVAGALAIFSDVPQYTALPGGLACLKPDNSVESWHRAIGEAIAMPPEEFDLMRRRMIAHVREEYSETAQIHLHEAALRATEFHAGTRHLRGPDGRPKILYVLHSTSLGGSEIQLLRRMRIARRYGIQPVAVLNRALKDTDGAQQLIKKLAAEQIEIEFSEFTCFTEPHSPEEFRDNDERAQVYELLKRCSPALVHTLIFNPTFGQVCSELRIPHVASLYAVEDTFSWPLDHRGFKHCNIVQSDSIRYATRWGKLLNAEKFCSREPVPEEAFRLGQIRYLASLEDPCWSAGVPPACGPEARAPRILVLGTFQDRKRQLEAIEAVGRLVKVGLDCRLDIYGYQHFNPEYSAGCRKRAQALDIEDRVSIHDFCDDPALILKSADLLLCPSTWESFPNSIKEAMAAGVLVVATPVGGIPELILDGVTGVLCQDTSIQSLADGIRRALRLNPIERRKIVEQARRVARSEFHSQRIASDMLEMYNRAVELNGVPEPEKESEIPLLKRRGKVESPAGRLAGDAVLRRRLNYSFTPKHNHWNGLSVFVGTHNRAAQGVLRLEVFSQSGVQLCESSQSLKKILDNSWVELRFPSIPNAAGKQFRLRFSLTGAGSTTKVSLYELEAPPPRILRLLRSWGIPVVERTLYCKSWYQE
jgi:O-antigen biosynthesis protein